VLKRQNLIVLAGLCVSLGILSYLVFRRDFGHLLHVAGSVEPLYVAEALLCSAASYIGIGLALWKILSLLGYPRSFSEVLGIAFVSSTANYLVSSAGISGFALKAHLLRKRRVPYGTTVLSSVLSTALMYFVLAVLIGQGLIYLSLRLGGARIAIMEGALGMLVLAVTSVPMLMFFFNHRLRGTMTKLVFRAIDFAVYSFSRKQIPKEDFAEFESQLAQGLGMVRREKLQLSEAIGYTCLDWFFAILVLYFGFRAVGLRLSVAHLSTAFAVGQAATLIPFLPGGLGAMEGVMTATLGGMGVGWDHALVAVLLYRLAYHIVPGLGSIFVLWGLQVSEPGLIRETVQEEAQDRGRRR